MNDGEEQLNAAGHYSIIVPESWSTREQGVQTSIESADKKINVDYIRDTKLNRDTLSKMLSENGAQVRQLPDTASGDIKISSYVSSQNGKSPPKLRLAKLSSVEWWIRWKCGLIINRPSGP